MIILEESKTLEIKLDGTVTTDQMDFVVSYVDISPTAFTSYERDGVTNNATAVTLVPAAPNSSTQRQLKYLSVYNKDTVSHVVTIQYNNNTTIRIIGQFTMMAGYTLYYSSESEFVLKNSDGVTVTSGSQGASGFSGVSGYSGTNGSNGSNGTSGFSGYSGIDGAAGTSGYSGVSGFSGTNGTNGASGVSGYSGSQGISGYSGAAGGGSWTTVVETTTLNKTSSSALSNTNLTFSVTAGNYAVRGKLFMYAASTTAGLKYRLDASTASLGRGWIVNGNGTSLNEVWPDLTANSLQNTDYNVTGGSWDFYAVEFFIADLTVDSSGSFTIQFAQSVSNANTSTFYKGSYIEYTKYA